MNWELFIHPSVVCASFSALAIQLLTLIEIKNIPRERRPDFKDPFYWLPFIISPIVGGGLALAYVYSNEVLTPLLAVNVGVSAPLILRSMANTNPFDGGGINAGQGA